MIATPNGLVIFDPLGKAHRWNIIDDRLERRSTEPPLFKTILPTDLPDRPSSKYVHSVVQDGNGNIFVSTKFGLYKLLKTSDEWQFQRVESEQWKTDKVEYFGNLYTDSRGDVWLLVDWFIYRILKTGEIQKVSEPGGSSFFEDRDGNIWIGSGGHDYGPRVFTIQNGQPVLKDRFTNKDGFGVNGFTNAIAQTSDGKILLSSNGTLHEFVPDAKVGELKFRRIENEASTSATDKSGNLWFSTRGKGVVRYLRNSFYIFDENDGVTKDWISSIFGNRNGEVFLTTGQDKLARVSEGKIETLQPFGLVNRDWVAISLDFQSADGEFWIPSTKGLLRYPALRNFEDLSRTRPHKIYTTADGLFTNTVTTVFEDSRGDVWIGATTKENSLLRWERSAGRIHRYTYEQGFPKESGVTTIGEDAAGNVWFGYYFGQLLRLKDGKFRDFTQEGLVSRNLVRSFLTDKMGRLWISTSSRGLFRVDEPDAETPVFTNFSMEHGLSSNQTWCATLDRFGRIYATTGRGINRIEPDTFRVKIFTQKDGLPANNIERCYADVNGHLWFSSTNSLIKYTPEVEKASVSPPIFIDAISINGKPRAISDLGEKEVKDLKLEPDERQVQVGFFAISFEPGETLRYQYKLNDQEWSEPSERRTVDFNLSPASYQLSVRAITANGVLSENSAVITMTIARPVWQRWWFILLAILFLGFIGFVVVRYRLTKIREVQTALEALNRSKAERLAELHRVRTRIATDLHDDIGSSLTQIAVLSEVARTQAAALESEGVSSKLESIKGVSRELVESMSDVVWAINPNKDTLSDLVQRMRRFGSDYCSARDIRFELDAPPSEEMIPLGANMRREILAIFKEVVNNSVKYSECKNVRVDFRIKNDTLLLALTDDGKGFDTETTLSSDFSPDQGGNGLINIRRRASELGGKCVIDSKIGSGTSVLLSVPLKLSETDILAPAQSGGENDRQANV